MKGIILDYHCKLENDRPEEDEFLGKALADIDYFCGKKQMIIPWYIYSAGNVEFESLLLHDIKNRYHPWDNGKGYYNKLNKEDQKKLFCNIKEAAGKTSDYKIMSMYKEVFEALDRWEFSADAKLILVDILKPMRFPDQYPQFDGYLYYNRLRQFVEYIFRVAYAHNLLPKECLIDNRVNLWESYNYMAGNELTYSNVRYGEQEDRILDGQYSSMLRELLFISNDYSHSEYTKLDPQGESIVKEHLKGAGSNYQLFGFTLQLCSMTLWLSSYLDNHSDEFNASMISEVPKPIKSDYENTEAQWPLEVDRQNNLHLGQCLVTNIKIGSMYHIYKGKIYENNKPNSKYPFVGRIDFTHNGK